MRCFFKTLFARELDIAQMDKVRTVAIFADNRRQIVVRRCAEATRAYGKAVVFAWTDGYHPVIAGSACDNARQPDVYKRQA